MTQILKQSTAVDVLIGPFLDKTDALTAETGESPSVKLSKNGQALGAKNDATTPVHDADGYHNCELDATDTDTIGMLVLTVIGSANALPVRHEYQVVEQDVFEFMYADGSSPDADVISILADTGELQTDWANGGRLDLLLDAVQTDLDNGTDGLGALKTLIDTVNTDLANGTDGLGALKTLIDTVNTDLSNATDGLGAIKAETALIVTDTGTTLQAELDAIQAAVITNAAGVDIAADIIAVKAETALIVTDTGTTLQAELDAIQAAVITNAAGADVAADIIAMKVDTAAILVDTDKFVFTVANQVDANVVAISGDATAADNLEASMETMVVGTADGGSTSTVESNVTGHGDDTFIGRVLLFRTGTLQHESGRL